MPRVVSPSPLPLRALPLVRLIRLGHLYLDLVQVFLCSPVVKDHEFGLLGAREYDVGGDGRLSCLKHVLDVALLKSGLLREA